MKRLALFASFTILVAGCRTVADSGTLDIATAEGDQTFLYYLEDSFVHRAGCNRETRLYDRTQCQTDIKRVEERAFSTRLERGVGHGIPEKSRAVEEQFVKLARVDEKLFELISEGQAAPAPDELTSQIEDAETNLTEINLVLQNLDQEIREISNRLATAPNVSLRQQLQDLQSEQIAATRKAQETRATLANLRNQYVQANRDAIDARIASRLADQRERFENDLNLAHAELEKALLEVATINVVLKMLADTSFTYEIQGDDLVFDAESTHVRRFHAIFSAIAANLPAEPIQPGQAGSRFVERPVESDHPYNNSSAHEFVIEHAGASSLHLHFARIALAGGDKLQIFDDQGTLVQTFAGPIDSQAVVSEPISGTKIVLKFVTDASLNQYGFQATGYSFVPLGEVDKPTLIKEEYLPPKHKFRNNGDAALANGSLYMRWEKDTYETRLHQLRITPSGLESGVDYRSPADQITACPTGSVFFSQSQNLNRFDEFEPFRWHSPAVRSGAETTALACDTRGFVYQFIGGRLQVINTRESPWETTISDEAMPRVSMDSRSRVATSDRYLAVSGFRKLMIFDIEDPYRLSEIRTIEIPAENDDQWGALLLVGETVCHAKTKRLSCYSIREGFEISALELPESAKFYNAKAYNDGGIIYLGLRSEVAVIDLRNAAAPTLLDRIKLVRNVDHAKSVRDTYKVGDELWVLWLPDTNGNGQDKDYKLSRFRLPRQYP